MIDKNKNKFNSVKLKIVISILLVACLLITAVAVLRGDKWDKYYKNKMYQPPRQLIVDALAYFKNPGTAIDLGSGVGNEAAFLLNNGWKVWAIDAQPKAAQLLMERNDIHSLDKLITITATFDQELKWEDLPQVDFVYASYSLPFSNPEKFDYVWKQVKEKILPGGRFAGHFFGLNYKGFTAQEMKNMTFLTLENVHHLFQDFTIEYFRESEKDGLSGTGRNVHSHIFEVIARKNSTTLH